MPAIVVHGGCGAISPEEEGSRNAACERAADAGWKALLSRGNALDAVEAAVRYLEEEPLLNAGTGSFLQADGVVRMDASIMASDGRAGSVAQVPNLRNPVRLSRYLLEQDAHIMLTGAEALHLALRLGHDSGVVALPQKVAYWQAHLSEPSRRLDYAAMAAEWKREHPRHGTVGCVALDDRGNLAAASSTGGAGHCYPGRVGDTPIIGAGTYCTSKVGVSMTGIGERIMVLLSAKRLCDLVNQGEPLQDAAQAVLTEIEALVPASAGLIALDVSGTIAAVWDTPFMAFAKRTTTGP